MLLYELSRYENFLKLKLMLQLTNTIKPSYYNAQNLALTVLLSITAYPFIVSNHPSVSSQCSVSVLDYRLLGWTGRSFLSPYNKVRNKSLVRFRFWKVHRSHYCSKFSSRHICCCVPTALTLTPFKKKRKAFKCSLLNEDSVALKYVSSFLHAVFAI